MSDRSHIEQERDDAMFALQNIHRWCIQYERRNISERELVNWIVHECEKVFYGEENARKI